MLVLNSTISKRMGKQNKVTYGKAYIEAIIDVINCFRSTEHCKELAKRGFDVEGDFLPDLLGIVKSEMCELYVERYMVDKFMMEMMERGIIKKAAQGAAEE